MEKEKKFTVLKQVYLYLIAAITLVMTIVSTVGLIRIVLNEYVFEVKGWEQMENPKSFWECSDDTLFYIFDEKGVKKLKTPGLSKEAMSQEKETCKQEAVASRESQHKNNVKDETVMWLSMLIVAFPIYLLHWKLARKEHKK